LRTDRPLVTGAIGSGGNSEGLGRYRSSALGSPSGLDAHAEAIVESGDAIVWSDLV
jgi:hypothetical protein